LIISAKNDPFLPKESYHVDEDKMNPNVVLKTPDSGGHVDFVFFNRKRTYWSEEQIVQFLNTL
jgi:uncharacterized protein